MTYIDTAYFLYESTASLAALAILELVNAKPSFHRVIYLSELSFSLKTKQEPSVSDTVDRIMDLVRVPHLISRSISSEAGAMLADKTMHEDQALHMLVLMTHEKREMYDRMVVRYEAYKAPYCTETELHGEQESRS